MLCQLEAALHTNKLFVLQTKRWRTMQATSSHAKLFFCEILRARHKSHWHD